MSDDADPVAAAARAEYPDDGSGIFLNAASYGLLPARTVRASNELTASRNRIGGFREEELGEALSRCRSAAARLLEGAPEEITLTPNTSFGVNLGAALARATRDPGTILVSHGEFPANVYPWMALEGRGFEVEVVPGDALGRPEPDRILERIRSDDVRVLALSAVQFASGYLADLEVFGQACRERDVLFVVDAIQALGAVPLRPGEAGVDLLACGGQKWLCGPWGSGFLWMDARHREAFDPPMVGWLSVEAALDFSDVLDYRWGFVKDGRKFELATLGIQDQLALAHSLELFLEIGPERIRRHIHRLHEPVIEWARDREDVTLVTPEDPDHRAGILAFSTGDSDATAGRLREAGVEVAVREGLVRLAPHFYNTLGEMEEVVEVLEGVSSRWSRREC